jgi:hypothetical protein
MLDKEVDKSFRQTLLEIIICRLEIQVRVTVTIPSYKGHLGFIECARPCEQAAEGCGGVMCVNLRKSSCRNLGLNASGETWAIAFKVISNSKRAIEASRFPPSAWQLPYHAQPTSWLWFRPTQPATTSQPPSATTHDRTNAVTASKTTPYAPPAPHVRGTFVLHASSTSPFRPVSSASRHTHQSSKWPLRSPRRESLSLTVFSKPSWENSCEFVVLGLVDCCGGSRGWTGIWRMECERERIVKRMDDGNRNARGKDCEEDG